MSWNYRVVRHLDETYGIHEVYYNKDGEAFAISAEPEAGSFESVTELLEEFRKMVREAEENPVFFQPKDGEWAKPDWLKEKKK